MKKAINKFLRKFGYSIVKIKKTIPKDSQSPSKDPFYYQKCLVEGKDNIVIFDVGAHCGQTTTKYNLLFNNCKIYSFEPFLDSYNILKETVSNYGNILTYNIALGNLEGDVDFYVNKFSATNSILPAHSMGSIIWGDNLLNNIEKIKVRSTTLDNFIKKMEIDQIDILKLDTQGTEYDVLEGAINTIKDRKIKIIYMEIITLPTYQNQRHFDEILKFMRLNRFELYNMYDYSLTKFGALRQVDAIFVNKIHMDKLLNSE